MPILSNSYEHIIHTVHLPLLKRLVQETNPLSALIYNFFAVEGKGSNINKLDEVLSVYTGQEQGKVQEETLAAPQMPNGEEGIYLKKIEIKNFRKFQDDFVFEVNLCSENDPGVPKSLFLIGENGVGKSSIYSAMEHVLQNRISEGDMRKRNFKQTQGNIAITLSDDTVVHSYEEFVEKYSTYELGAIFCSEYDIFTVGQEQINNDWISFFGRSMGYGDLLDLREFLKAHINNDDWKGYIEHHTYELKKLKNEYSETEVRLDSLKESFKLNLFDRNRKNLRNILSEIADSVKAVTVEVEKQLNSEHISTNNLERNLQYLERALDNLPLTNKHIEIRSLKDQVVNFSNLLIRNNQRYKASSLNDPSAINLFRNIATGDRGYQTDQQRDLLNDISTFLESFGKNFSEILLKELETSYSSLRELKLNIESTSQKVKSGKIELIRKEQVDQYCQKLDEALCEEMMPELKKLIPVITKIMEKFKLDIEKHELNISFDDKKCLNIYVVRPDKDQRIEPAVFYNNFRYKLFCLLLKLVTGIGYMKKQEVIRPIIMDDVFYASDFYSKSKVKFFFETLLEAIDELLPGKKLQIICFTHDEIVLNAIYESTSKEAISKALNNEKPDTIFGRIIEAKKVIENASRNKEEEFKHRGNLYIELYV